MNETSALAAPLAPLSLQMRRGGGPLVGRPAELAAIRSELSSAAGGSLAALTVEGEPGIGKTRLLVEASEEAAGMGFAAVGVTADEEIRGPFLVARSLLTGAGRHYEGAQAESLAAAAGLLSGGDDPGFAGMPPDQKLLRSLDLAAGALRSAAMARPLCLLVDDLQWVDDDTVRLLRYLVRAAADVPVFLGLALRTEEMIDAHEARTLIADMHRMGMVRRLALARLNQAGSAALAEAVLGGRLEPGSAATMHSQAEGVPFIVEELARTYRETGMIHEIDGTWTLARNVKRLLPSSVRTLIERRAARLPDVTRTALAQAAVLGRSFHLNDLRAVKVELGDDPEECTPGRLAEALEPGVSAGLLVLSPESSAADYRFAHEHVREFSMGSLSDPARRGVHAAIVTILTKDAAPLPQSFALLAHHAASAGDHERAAVFSIEASRVALASRAPEEVLRTVEAALPSASDPAHRVQLLTARDEAFEMLRRPADRLEVLAELSALAGAMGDERLELEIMLRRASALRLSGQEDRAAAMAREVQSLAADRQDAKAQIRACLELGQSLMRRPLGESFGPPSSEADLEGAVSAFEQAAALAETAGDRASLAAARRELGVARVGIARAWLIDNIQQEEEIKVMKRIAEGETPESVFSEYPVLVDLMWSAQGDFESALETFDALGDRRGVMSTIIGMAYVRFGIDIHWRSSAKGIEEIRRLAARMKSLTNPSDPGSSEVQMLFAAHVFARAKAVYDLALTHGTEAHERSRILGDRALEFAAAGGMALSHLDLGEIPEAERWLDRAAEAAASMPTPSRSRRLELWRGMAAGAAGDAAAMRAHLDRAARPADGSAHPAAVCEARSALALWAAKLGAAAEPPDAELLGAAREAAAEALEIAGALPGHAEWRARAQAALAVAARADGDPAAAAAHGRQALEAIQGAHREDVFLDVFVPASEAVVAGSPEDAEDAREMLRIMVLSIARRILDEDVRVRFFRGPLGSALAELAGDSADPAEILASVAPPQPALEPGEARMLWMLVEGMSNAEIAAKLGVGEDEVTRSLARIYAKIGASSRAEAAALVLRDRVL